MNVASIFQFSAQDTCRASSVPSSPSATAPTSFPDPLPPSSHETELSANMSFISHNIIPPEDLQCPVELDDEDDGNLEISGDGLGDEDEFSIEGDEADDERDPGEEDAGMQDMTGLHPRRPMPLWLRDAFKLKVTKSAQRNKKGLPPLYANHQTFWFPQPSTFFILQWKVVSPQNLYNPKFTLWDPESLCPNGIPCPNCCTWLCRLCHISHPRRCVSINETFIIIGYRYRCPKCLHPVSGKNTVTFRNWDTRILAVLPSELATKFPARLSHRSGISTTLAGWMWSCFQNGMGAKQFSDALCVQHLLKYDELHLQYLDLLARCTLDGWSGQKYEAFPLFENRGPQGLHGFVPGAIWIQDMYDCYIEEHKSKFNQHTAMLSAEICALDHSHKITKHITKVNGEEVFTALLTVTNQLGKIRSCNLVATKSHAQFEEALKGILHSLKLYSHILLYLFFTDNMADKQFLEHCFLSLLESVVPVEKYQNLEPLVVPDNVLIFI
ncbi:uncharacterized protein LACBIDRAFT_302278 [Laccaria bicolor S238N-H82]|uniref:Predicted protein n=1 Tax=Laccaria bicolor (strain S238N-H82 / ATCC MYA-4686) TaxID=486041 RepID=B0DHG1_LACBS|nr:uncharacterized protein LACBIDRAFT_302278 [Laccaria bicolor S238N-H82]EDR06014.1 predicted protein [Laccaria bicolor S238N-H82]|eukprot:XP_001883302.1 predicted protein [Laccaria bicolor S238N-H82]